MASADFPLAVGPATRMAGGLPGASGTAMGRRMSYIMTCIAARDGGVLTDRIVDRVREAVGGGTIPRWLSAGEAAEFMVSAAPDIAAARAALEGGAIDVLVTRV